MAGRIRAEDVATVKERSSIEDIISEHVTLRPAGPGSLKGLCPIHDEKTPSFTVRPAVGAWHCFGCGEGGDVISFLMQVEHLTFTESVERLAGKLGFELRYEEGGRPDGESVGRRGRLIEAHRVAQEFYAEVLFDPRSDRIGRDFLRERGFDGAAARLFGVGLAPRGGDQLVRHLLAKKFTDDEIVLGGLAGRSSRGLYDRFRGRLVWPIRDITGDTVGFGARRLFDDDRIEAKYLNTSETPIYKKSTVLYGLDLAKKAIAKDRQSVVVEGYTDVMACQLAGIESAVATCGTAFGTEHIKILRRIMRDEAGGSPARVIFTFDGDAAGQKAAMRAFEEDQRWASQSFVAVAAEGRDPCDLRLAEGDEAVRNLIEDAVPLFEFAVRTTVDRFDLRTAEGRVLAIRAAAPIVASIRDTSLRPEYVRTVAGWLGVEVEQVATEVAKESRKSSTAAKSHAAPERAQPSDAEVEPTREEIAAAGMPMPDLRDPAVAAERQLLQIMLQQPNIFAQGTIAQIEPDGFVAPAHRATFEAVRTALGAAGTVSTAGFAGLVSAAVPSSVAPLVSAMSVASLPIRVDEATGLPPRRYVEELVVRVRSVALARRIADGMSELRRLDHSDHPDPQRQRELAVSLNALQREAADLRESLA